MSLVFVDDDIARRRIYDKLTKKVADEKQEGIYMREILSRRNPLERQQIHQKAIGQQHNVSTIKPKI